ncbi:hypothetical protein EDD11_009395, partial [Mortierella claussenii]
MYVSRSTQTDVDKSKVILSILDTLSECGLTIRTLFEKLFTYEDSEVVKRVEFFYGKDGPAFFIKLWSRLLRHHRHKMSFTDAACEVVLEQASKDIKKISSLGTLHCPVTSISRKVIEDFSLPNIVATLKEHTPLLSSLLTGLMRGDEGSCRTPEAIVPTIASMLLFQENSHCNSLQTMMGLYLYSTGAPRKTIDILSRAGLSVSYSSIMRALRALTEDALATIRDVAKHHSWYLVYDNINIASRRSDQRISNGDTFESGATATIILSESFNQPDLTTNPYSKLCFKDLLPDFDSCQHFAKVCQYHLRDALRMHSNRYNCCLGSAPQKCLLPLKQTVAFPLPSMKIDQATVEGNISIIETIVQNVLQLPATFFDNGKRVVIAGDQLTIARIRTIKSQRWDDTSPYNRVEWAVP